ncbi:MAG: hypothetical protein NTV46_10300 [Verrucomicrobia bacterium]|nr:hypothetical protein [Verrucomicrobiota bacterium]
MKMKSTILFGTLALIASQASADTKVFNLTGATAFRASSHTALIAVLGGAGTTQYAYTGTSGIGGASRSIFVGSMAAFPGHTIIVRCSWSGSTQGIKDVEDNNSIQFIDDNIRLNGVTDLPNDLTNGNPVTTTGYNLGATGNEVAQYENAVAQWSFSDVDKLLSERPNASLTGGAVGVVPFMFLAGEGSPAELNNMTDQLHRSLWGAGQLPIAFFTGNTTDATTVLATGRNNGSGTRATILSETGYGSGTGLTQFGATYQGTRTDPYPTGMLLTVTELGNGGGSSNDVVREFLTRSSVGVTYGGSPVDVVFVGYLTISDALNAIGEGAKEMKYNGVSFSAENVKKGLYSLWGYQQFYLDNDASADETTFDTAFRTAIPGTLVEPNAIAIPNMSVTRTGGDGGPIIKNTNYPNP